jgi:NAD(P)-dependent dehydrogenase (short-subunit alcohol dehydrogenase family)
VENRAPVTEVSADQMRRTYETNVFGVVTVTNTLLPLLRRAGGARIVNVSAMLGSLSMAADPQGPFSAWPGAFLLACNSSKTALNASRAVVRVFCRKQLPAPLWYHAGMAMTLRLPPEVEDQLKQIAATEHRSVQQTVLVAIEEYLSMRETAEILADPAALRGLAEARESEQAGDVVYGAEAARALLAERKR